MYIKVRVTAGAKRESIISKTDDHFFVSVREPAERNLANQRVRQLIAGEFRVSEKQVRIVSGHTSPSKIVSIAEQ